MNDSAVSLPLDYHCTFIDSIHDIAPAHWHALTGTDYPFLRHEFLAALEDSRCTSPGTGWTPHHLVIHAQKDDLSTGPPVAVLPLYLKTDSFGEYVFDWAWADAYRRHGLEYYPKLLSAIPFTPAQGPRFCVADEHQDRRQALLRLAVEAIQKEAEATGASGWHLLFPDADDSQTLETLGVHQRQGCQYHWFDHGYGDFEGMLASFASRKRKNIRKERRRVSEAGIHFRVIEGQEMTDELWQCFYAFYEHTYLLRGRPPYLNEDFFHRIGQTIPEHLVFILAQSGSDAVEDAIAGALSFKGSDTLYGRYWGAESEREFLHFETCYYQGIDYCLANGLTHFDSGAQGEHKIQRGFEPVTTWSNHWLAHPEFNRAIEHFVQEESEYVERFREHAGDYLPFRQGSG